MLKKKGDNVMGILLFILLIIGFILLVKGADIFVDGSSSLARRLKVPGLIIGLTIVAMGTSMPEFAVSTVAAFKGANEIALSNVVGSNIFNLLSVLGVCAILCPVPVETAVLKRDFPVSVIITFLLLPITGAYNAYLRPELMESMYDTVGIIGRHEGLLLIICFVAYMIILIVSAGRNHVDEDDEEVASFKKCVLYIASGLIMIILGGQAVVYSAREIAVLFGMSETLIGLTIVAVGTSLPELVTSIVAARKGETSLAIGNVIGSNIFNILFILGASALIDPIGVNYASAFDIGILVVVTILVYLSLLVSKSLNRFHGTAMVLIYIASVVFAALR